ncbi:hypothetical protein CVS40_8531 [Lucilia cuprina]|nr:hypothetical protein CVS40_8531 [Lucilia cuprina]
MEMKMGQADIILCVSVISIVKARPGYLPTAVAVPTYQHYAYEPTVVGHTVTHLPTAISHQSQTIVHEKRPYLKPIVGYQPAEAYVKAHYLPASTKYVAAAPLAYAPVTYTTDLYPTGWDTGLTYSKGWNGWPLK